ncbi:MAG: type III pantothenate kinase [Xanthomonadales bacterium]|nr:type III pantothenate kinase [Xanthomonadales bacterium]
MILLDLGNTRLKLAALRDGEIADVSAIAHRDNHAFHAQLLAELGRRRESGVAAVAWLASVHHGAALDEVLAALGGHGFSIRHITQARSRDDLRLAYADVTELGVDRWLAMLGVRSGIGGDLLLVSAGTALTIDLIDASGRHHGGCIAPSPMRMVDGLRQAASHLPQPPLSAMLAPRSLFAGNTMDGLAAGAQGATLGLVRQAAGEAREQLGRSPTLVLTGGGAAALIATLAGHPEAIHFKYAVLQGLSRLASEARSGTAEGTSACARC